MAVYRADREAGVDQVQVNVCVQVEVRCEGKKWRGLCGLRNSMSCLRRPTTLNDAVDLRNHSQQPTRHLPLIVTTPSSTARYIPRQHPQCGIVPQDAVNSPRYTYRVHRRARAVQDPVLPGSKAFVADSAHDTFASTEQVGSNTNTSEVRLEPRSRGLAALASSGGC